MFLPLIVSMIFSTFNATASAEPGPSVINLERVSKVVKKRLIEFGAENYSSPDDFALSCGETFNPEGFDFNHMAFEINENIEKVWNTYMTANPKTAWSGKSIQFDFAYSKQTKSYYYHDDEQIPQPHVGMGFFILLNVYNLKKLPASLEISKIDPEQKIFEYTYLNKNTAHGRQSVRLIDLGNNKTRVVHDTHFKSESNFRDKYLYPPIHEALLEEFHQNVMNTIGVIAKRVE